MSSAAALFSGTDVGASLLWESLWEIGGAVLLGVVLGIPAAALTGRLQPGRPTQEEAYALVFLCAGAAILLDVSFLLAAVVLGATIATRASHHEVPFREIERIEWPALIVFFLLAGASLEISSLREAGWLTVGYVVLRSVGKLAGCLLGGRVRGLPPEQAGWLGAAMLPQAGVAIGLTLLAAERFSGHRRRADRGGDLGDRRVRARRSGIGQVGARAGRRDPQRLHRLITCPGQRTPAVANSTERWERRHQS